MAKFGIALGSGPRGLGFESRYSDQNSGIRHRGFRNYHFKVVSFQKNHLISFIIQEVCSMLSSVRAFIKKEAVLTIAAVCAVATMFLIPPDAEYLHYIDFRVLALLLCLMTVVA